MGKPAAGIGACMTELLWYFDEEGSAPPPASAGLEGLILNGLDLNQEHGPFALEAFDPGLPKKKAEWMQSADGDGADLLRTPLYENRLITATIRITPQGSQDLALHRLGELVAILQEAEKNQDGIPLEWTPSGASGTATFYVLSGEVTGIPIVMEGNDAGWFVFTPKITIQMNAKPFGYLPAITLPAVSSNGQPYLTLLAKGVPGDVPAEAILTISDGANVGRRFVEWGLESRYLNTALPLLIDSEDMVPVSGAQSIVLNTHGAYKRTGATNGTIATALLGKRTICCETSDLGHVGTFRVKARVQLVETASGGGVTGIPDASSRIPEPSNVHVRLAWQDGSGPLRGNSWVTPALAGKFVELDLGIVTVTPAVAGSQKWRGVIEAYSDNEIPATEVPVDVLHVDYLTIVPVLEGYGKARGIQGLTGEAIVAHDDFAGGSGSLNGRVSELGAAWATSGSGGDFVVESTQCHRDTLSDTEPRFALLGPSEASSSISAELAWLMSITPNDGVTAPGTVVQGLVTRWVDANNFAFALLICTATAGTFFTIGLMIAGSATILWTRAVPGAGNQPNQPSSLTTLKLVAATDGSLKGMVSIGSPDGTPDVTLQGSHSALLGTGTLATGKSGLYDYAKGLAVGQSRRTYAAFDLSLPPPIPFCIQPGRQMQIGSDSTIAADSSGVHYGPVSQYRGSRIFVPPEGAAFHFSRVLVKVDRNDLEESDQQVIGDNFTAQLTVIPRFIAVPH
jgi:hypothetical protein